MSAKLRQDADRGAWPDTLEEVIRAFTQAPAWVSRKENQLGTLAPGKKADLVVFSRDLFQTAPDQLASVHVEMTMVDGEVLYHTGQEGR